MLVMGLVRVRIFELRLVMEVQGAQGENATTAPNKLHMTKGGDYVALRLGGSGYAHDYEEARRRELC